MSRSPSTADLLTAHAAAYANVPLNTQLRLAKSHTPAERRKRLGQIFADQHVSTPEAGELEYLKQDQEDEEGEDEMTKAIAGLEVLAGDMGKSMDDVKGALYRLKDRVVTPKLSTGHTLKRVKPFTLKDGGKTTLTMHDYRIHDTDGRMQGYGTVHVGDHNDGNPSGTTAGIVGAHESLGEQGTKEANAFLASRYPKSKASRLEVVATAIADLQPLAKGNPESKGQKNAYVEDTGRTAKPKSLLSTRTARAAGRRVVNAPPEDQHSGDALYAGNQLTDRLKATGRFDAHLQRLLRLEEQYGPKMTAS